MLEDLAAELQLRGLSTHTIKSYVRHNEEFLKKSKKNVDSVEESDVKAHLASMLQDGKSTRSVALAKAALRFYFDELHKKQIVTFKTPKPEKKLPVVLTRDEIKAIIEAAPTAKSKLMLKLLYSSGLRLSEAVNLQKKDIELGEGIGWVRRGKGGKDRMFILSEALKRDLTPYLLEKAPGKPHFCNKKRICSISA